MNFNSKNNQLKHISNQQLAEELTSRVQQGIINLDQLLKVMKNSTLLKELERRIKEKEIRFNYDSPYPPQNINSLISWDATDKYDLDFAKLEEYLEKTLWR